MKPKKRLVIVFLLATLLCACGGELPVFGADPPAVQAETDLAQGIAAQEKGKIIEALAYYYNAAASDPALDEASKRLTELSAGIEAGSIDQNVRSDIELRKEWLKILNECAAFFKEHLPYRIEYDPSLTTGPVDYQNETAKLRCFAVLWPTPAFRVLDTLLVGLEKTGKRETWGFGGWPLEGEGKVIEAKGEFPLEAALLNNKGRIITTTQTIFTTAVSKEGLIISRPEHLRTITFTVKAKDLSDNMTVRITKINGRTAPDAVSDGYIKIALTSYTPPEKDYKIGDIGPAGGIIFCNQEHGLFGWRYLEAAPQDLPNAEWGTPSAVIEVKRGDIGWGKRNTQIIVNALAGRKEIGSAAQLCDEYALNEYEDWFLPSRDELNLMYANLHKEGLGDFRKTHYWSSSEDSDNTAWRQYFGNGSLGCNYKYYPSSVRAVRAF
jgi:hypothetical protein